MNPQIKVLVVEDQAVVRQGLTAILSFYEDIKVVGEAENGVEAVKIVEELKPDVILLDMVMPIQGGLETIPKILKIAPKTRILVVTAFSDTEKIVKAINLGAVGYLLKDATSEELINAIREVYKGEAFIPSSMALMAIRGIEDYSSSTNKPSPLTNKEMETLQYIAKGLANQEIAHKLTVTEGTVAKNVSKILSKLQLENRTQIALYALRKGLVEDGKE